MPRIAVIEKDKKPKIEGKCDNCENELYVRDDETEEAIKERIKQYKEKTLPVVEFYRKKEILVEINGNNNIEAIYEDIRKLFK